MGFVFLVKEGNRDTVGRTIFNAHQTPGTAVLSEWLFFFGFIKAKI